MVISAPLSGEVPNDPGTGGALVKTEMAARLCSVLEPGNVHLRLKVSLVLGGNELAARIRPKVNIDALFWYAVGEITLLSGVVAASARLASAPSSLVQKRVVIPVSPVRPASMASDWYALTLAPGGMMGLLKVAVGREDEVTNKLTFAEAKRSMSETLVLRTVTVIRNDDPTSASDGARNPITRESVEGKIFKPQAPPPAMGIRAQFHEKFRGATGLASS